MRVFLSLVLFTSAAAISFAQAPARKAETLKIEADPAAGFSYSYYLFVPGESSAEPKSEPDHILVVPNNTGQISDDLGFHEDSVKRKMLQAAFLFNKLNTFVLMPVFPRPKTEWKIYTHALDRDSLVTSDKRFRRLDLQLAAMIEHAGKQLDKRGFAVKDRVLMYGYSAAGMFANRFSFLHPKLIKAVAVGSPGGWPIAPVDKSGKESLRYPIGVDDLKTLTGSDLDLVSLRRVSMFVFLGDQDTNDSLVFRDGYEAEDESLVFRQFGKTPVERWEKAAKMYDAAGLNAEFKLYEGVDHKPSFDMREDVIAFFKKNMD